MSDVEALQGLWKIESLRSKGRLVRSAGTHYLFTGNSMKEIVPNLVSDGKLRSTFVVDDAAFPKRLTTTLDYNGPDGPPDPKPIILRYLYQLDGESLILCSGVLGSFPDAITEDHSIKTLIRDHGPIPESKKPSGTPPLVDDLLGTLEWNDNLNWYRGKVRVENDSIELSLSPEVGTNASSALARTRQYQQMAADYDGGGGAGAIGYGGIGGKRTGQQMTHYIAQGGRFERACTVLLDKGFAIPWQAITGDVEVARKKAASKTKYTCPGCLLNAWGKPDIRLVCGDCEVELVA